MTIWGESAGEHPLPLPFVRLLMLLTIGAGSVLQHLVAHGGNTQPPLFHRAMTSSTFLPNQYNFDDKVPEVIPISTLTFCTQFTHYFQFIFSETAKLAGYESLSSHWPRLPLTYLPRCSNSKDTFACLVAADAGLLQTVNTQVCGNGFSDTFITVPVTDNEFLVERPIETISKGKLNTVRRLVILHICAI